MADVERTAEQKQQGKELRKLFEELGYKIFDNGEDISLQQISDVITLIESQLESPLLSWEEKWECFYLDVDVEHAIKRHDLDFDYDCQYDDGHEEEETRAYIAKLVAFRETDLADAISREGSDAKDTE